MSKFSCFLALFLINFSFAQETDSSNTSQERKEEVLYPQKTLKNPSLDLIDAPEGFESSPYFNGYVHYQKRSAIIMYEIENMNPEIVMKAASDSYFEEYNMTLLKREQFTSEHGTKGFYMKSSYVDKGQTYIRYMVYAGNNKTTLILDIVHPKMIEMHDELKKCMESINYLR